MGLLLQCQKELMDAYREGDYTRALRMGKRAIALSPLHRGTQQFVQLLRNMVEDDSGASPQPQRCEAASRLDGDLN